MVALFELFVKFLTGPLAGPIFLALFIGAAGTATIERFQIHGTPFIDKGYLGEISDLQAKIDGPNGFAAQLARAHDNEAVIQAGLDSCNSGVLAAKKAADAMRARAAQELARALDLAHRLQKSAADILAAKPSGDKCTSLDALIQGAYK